jgi:hypothetical protein
LQIHPDIGEGAPPQADFAAVRAIALAEMRAAVPGSPGLARRVVEAALAAPANALARSLCDLDADVAAGSLSWAARRRLDHYGVVSKAERGPPVPGPVVFVSNHPGLFDCLGLFAAIERDDLSTLAARRPLLSALPNVSARLLSIPPGASAGMALRGALRHLRRGGALLHFPAGRIEPDPALVRPDEPALSPWQPGLDALLAAARDVCDLRVVPVLVSGVISPRARWISQTLMGRGASTDVLVPLLQLTFPGFGDVDMRVRFGTPRCATSPDVLEASRRELSALADALVGSRWKTGPTVLTLEGK